VRDDQKQADTDGDGLKDDHPREGVARVGASSAPAGHREQDERDRDQTDPDPLAATQLEAEEPLGEHRQKHETSRQHGLTDRDRSQAQRGNVQRERHRRHAPPDAPPPRAKEIGGAAQRMVHVDVGSLDRAPVFEQEGEIGPERRQQRTEQADADSKRETGHGRDDF
jgi:hypothetical protein